MEILGNVLVLQVYGYLGTKTSHREKINIHNPTSYFIWQLKDNIVHVSPYLNGYLLSQSIPFLKILEFIFNVIIQV